MALDQHSEAVTSQRWWNGAPVVAERMYVRRVIDSTVHKAVIVWLPDRQLVLDDCDGDAWYKVTIGRGAASLPHHEFTSAVLLLDREPPTV